jgi:hypothetical protein
MANRTSYINDAMNLDLELGVKVTLKPVLQDTKFLVAKNTIKPELQDIKFFAAKNTIKPIGWAPEIATNERTDTAPTNLVSPQDITEELVVNIKQGKNIKKLVSN